MFLIAHGVCNTIGVSDADLAQLHTLVSVAAHYSGRRPLLQTSCARPLLDFDVGDAGYFVEVADLEDHAAGAWQFGDEGWVAHDDRRRRRDDAERRYVRDRK